MYVCIMYNILLKEIRSMKISMSILIVQFFKLLTLKRQYTKMMLNIYNISLGYKNVMCYIKPVNNLGKVIFEKNKKELKKNPFFQTCKNPRR